MADLTVTNAYSKGKAKTPLIINGNVEISNYKQGETKPSAFVRAQVNDGKVSIQSNKGNVQTLDLSNEKYNVMLKIANSSKDDSGSKELSWYDLRDTDKANLGLGDSFVIKKDLKAGILNIYKKVGGKLTTWLHIDFETKGEKTNNSQQSKTQNTISSPKGKFTDPNAGVKKEEITIGEHEDIVGYRAKKGNVTSYYDTDKKFVGVEEKVEDCWEHNGKYEDDEAGTYDYKDKNGNLLYSVERRHSLFSWYREDATYYDSKGKIKYDIAWTENEICTITEYDSNGKVKHTHKRGYSSYEYFDLQKTFSDVNTIVNYRYTF